MSVSIDKLDDIEQDRLRLAQELAADSGENWADQYRPGTAGCHELLDRTALFANMLEDHLIQHPACLANREWYSMAEKAAAALHELYQKIGAAHLGSE